MRIAISLLFLQLAALNIFGQSNPIFSGGHADGFTIASYKQDLTLPVAAESIFGGGHADGFTVGSYTQPFILAENTNIFGGGNSDGFTADSYEQAFVLPQLSGIYGGGEADGFSRDSYLQDYNLPANELSVFGGGVGDGFVIYNETPVGLLPVSWLSFEAERLNDQIVELTWQTATEIDNHGFEVWRAMGNTQEWEYVGFVAGNGSSTQLNSYSYTDPNAYTGISYYKLKQLDYNGSGSWSAIRAVNGYPGNNKLVVQAYPNPTLNEVQVYISQPGSYILTLYDATGRLILNKVTEQRSTLKLDGLAQGYYHLLVSMDGTTVERLKIIKQ